MWQRFKLAWKIMFNGYMDRNNLQTFLNLLPEKPLAKATNVGKKWLIEFAIKMDKPKERGVKWW